MTRLRNEPEWVVLIGLLVLLVGAGGSFYYYRYQQQVQSAKQRFHRSLALYVRASRTGNDQQAIATLSRFVENHPKSHRTDKIHFFLGKLYLRKTNYLDAIRQFKTLLKKFPDSLLAPSAWLHVGYANARRGEVDQAIQSYGNLVSNYPSHPLVTEAKWQRAILFSEKGRTKKASSILNQIATLKRESFWTEWAGQLKNRLDSKS